MKQDDVENPYSLIKQVMIGVLGILLAAGVTSLNITWATAKQNEINTAKLQQSQQDLVVELKLLDRRVDTNDIRWARVEETMKWLERYLEEQKVPKPKRYFDNEQ